MDSILQLYSDVDGSMSSVQWFFRFVAMAAVIAVMWYNGDHGQSLVIDLICLFMALAIGIESLMACFKSLFFDGDEDRQPDDVWYGPNVTTSGFGGISSMAYIATAPTPSFAF